MAFFRLSGPVGLYTGPFRKNEGQIRTQRQKLSQTSLVRLRNSAVMLPTLVFGQYKKTRKWALQKKP